MLAALDRTASVEASRFSRRAASAPAPAATPDVARALPPESRRDNYDVCESQASGAWAPSPLTEVMGRTR